MEGMILQDPRRELGRKFPLTTKLGFSKPLTFFWILREKDSGEGGKWLPERKEHAHAKALGLAQGGTASLTMLVPQLSKSHPPKPAGELSCFLLHSFL